MHLVLKFWLWGRFVAEKQTYVLNLMAGHLLNMKTASEMSGSLTTILTDHLWASIIGICIENGVPKV